MFYGIDSKQLKLKKRTIIINSENAKESQAPLEQLATVQLWDRTEIKANVHIYTELSDIKTQKSYTHLQSCV